MRPTADAVAEHEVSIDIAATAETVYDMVADITRMGEWSPEATGGAWLDGATGKVGDWFTGNNATPEREWQRDCQVAAAERGADFTFVVGGMEENCTWWSYEMAPTAAGCTVTERWWIVNFTPAMAAATDEQRAGRIAMTGPMMEQTLAGLKAVAEAS